MCLPGRQSCQRDHVLGAETAVSTRGVRTFSPSSQERLGVLSFQRTMGEGASPREGPSGHLGSSEVTHDSELIHLAGQSVRIPCDEAPGRWLAGAETRIGTGCPSCSRAEKTLTQGGCWRLLLSEVVLFTGPRKGQDYL